MKLKSFKLTLSQTKENTIKEFIDGLVDPPDTKTKYTARVKEEALVKGRKRGKKTSGFD